MTASNLFQKAIKYDLKLRMGLVGASGCGKTYTALKLASFLGKKIAVIDTEFGSARKYADLFNFDVCEISDHSPGKYIELIQGASQSYDVLIIDSLSHAWSGRGGALEMVDKAMAKERGNRFAAWRHVTPVHNQLIESILSAPCHIIATMRAKQEYVMEEYRDQGHKKTRPVKVGLAPIQRDGMEYEFDVVADMDHANNLIIGKTRCSALADGVFPKPGEEVADILLDWLSGDCENPEVAFQDFLSQLSEVRKASRLSRQAVIGLAQSTYEFAGEDLRKIPEDRRTEFLELVLNSSQATAA